MKMIKTAVGITLILLVLSVSCCLEPEDRANHHIAYEKATDRVVIQYTFDEGSLNPELWQFTRDGNFKEGSIDVYDVDPTETMDYRLRLRANTIGTRDDTVKFLGVRNVEKVNFSNDMNISFDLQMSSHSNYPAREIYFDNIVVASDALPNSLEGN